MKINLSFKEYLDANNRLKKAGQVCPRVKRLYEVRKYCKIPLLESVSDDEKQYISLKPKDRVEILWEYETLDNPTPKTMTIVGADDQTMFFAWSDAKVKKWVKSSINICA